MTKEAPRPTLPENAVPLVLNQKQQLRLTGVYDPKRQFFGVYGVRDMPGDKNDGKTYLVGIYNPDGTRAGGNLSI